MTAASATAAEPASLFARILCGVDDSDAGLVAARLAARIAEPGSVLALVSVVDHSAADSGGGLGAVSALRHLRGEELGRYAVRASRLKGRAIDALLSELERERATLAVVGSRGHSRPTGIVLGSVTTFLLHEAPCSVLVAREPERLSAWPQAIVVGLDGSPPSVAALAAARSLAKRFGSSLRTIAATQDPRLEVSRVRAHAEDAELHDARPVDALAVASEHADLLVVGSRALSGVRALASVSERVAHEARCSVLVVRSAP